MQLTQVLQSFVIPEENLNEDQVLMLDTLGKSLQEGSIINLTEEEIQQYTEFKHKLELFESNLSEETLQVLNEGWLNFFLGNIKDVITIKEIRVAIRTLSIDQALKNLSKIKRDAIDFIEDVWPEDRETPTKVYLTSSAFSTVFCDDRYVKDLLNNMDTTKENIWDSILTLNSMMYDIRSHKNTVTRITKNRKVFIEEIEKGFDNFEEILKMAKRKMGGSFQLFGRANIILSSISAFILFIRQQSRMAT